MIDSVVEVDRYVVGAWITTVGTLKPFAMYQSLANNDCLISTKKTKKSFKSKFKEVKIIIHNLLLAHFFRSYQPVNQLTASNTIVDFLEFVNVSCLKRHAIGCMVNLHPQIAQLH